MTPEEMDAGLAAKLKSLSKQKGRTPVEFVLGGVQFRLMLNEHFGGVPGTVWEYDADDERRFIVMDTDCDKRITISQAFARGDELAFRALQLYDRLSQEDFSPILSYCFRERVITVNCRFHPPNRPEAQ